MSANAHLVTLIAHPELSTTEDNNTMTLDEFNELPRERDERDYRVKLKHDRGATTFRIFASSARSAASRMLALECAPVAAIAWVK